jgi:eukaryotic-like serine/threonine-protein kinase
MPSITDSIGRVLGDRYRLVTPLGTGASAHVYLADDVSLHRRVAIKILHPALAGDSAFLKRFRAEAVAVAALNHPNILQVYDWGEEEDEPYLVLEYLAGGSLRQIFDTGVLLTPEQATQVGLQAAAGLDYAHRRSIIHRDIKPANLLFDLDGRLRIADFGLARALAEAAWTEPDGAMLGTARYAAPEQVEGWVLDGKADVYALALVLYEAVTGETPFIGDTTVATLMARVGSLLPEHEALGPLGEVLVWAAAPDPDERLDAAALGRQLRTLADDLPDAAPIPVAAGVAADVAADEFDDITRINLRPGRRSDPGTRGPDLTELGAPSPVGATSRADPPRNGADPDVARRRSRRRWPWIAVAAVLVAALVAAGTLFATRDRLFVPSHPVPLLTGMSLAQATKAVHHDHFKVRATGHANSITVGTGLIVGQHPVPRGGHKPLTLKQGSTISVVLSSGPPPVAIPSLAAATNCTEAVQALQAAHLVGACPPTAAQYSSTVVAGAVITTVPVGTAIYGSTVTVVLSRGHAPVAIPAIAPTSTYAAAAAALTAVGFVPSQANAYSSTVPTGQVIGTTPPASAGPQPFGSRVTVSISLGPQPVVIPNEIGQSVAAATAALEAEGLKVAGPYGPAGSSTVLSLDPAAGTTVQPGTTVNVYTL